ncbi:hypothetical protein NJ7G_1721 [Natrinema sp. J7-2]|uniref:Uncharacterized protein n=1 Tax=Natrinema gari JCM 14663 TaxID=1230459 RepID=L9ZAD9_9EURY|nr:hypothetical protein NJ7G_1721 [Natrinema sp. J7-2]ELY82123.1 hypothetical protein C486_05634 [Natrinema gari JCM 14663]
MVEDEDRAVGAISTPATILLAIRSPGDRDFGPSESSFRLEIRRVTGVTVLYWSSLLL